MNTGPDLSPKINLISRRRWNDTKEGLVIFDDTKIKPYDAYCIHNAVRLHFLSGKYDYFRYNGKTKVMSPVDFSRDKKKFEYTRVVRKYPTALEVQSLCACNYAQDGQWYITNHADPVSRERFLSWKRFHETPLHFFAKDLDIAATEVERKYEYRNPQFTDLWVRNNEKNDNPVLFDLWVRKEIHTETVCVMNRAMGLFDLWDIELQYDPFWDEVKRSIRKYDPFVMRNITDIETYRNEIRKIVKRLVDYT